MTTRPLGWSKSRLENPNPNPKATTELIMLFQTIISACFSLIFRIQDPLALNLVPDPKTAYVGEYLLNISGHFSISRSSDADANFTILKQ